MSSPPDPVSVLAGIAAQLHELYQAYVAAGFSEGQALYLVGQVLTASARGPQ